MKYFIIYSLIILSFVEYSILKPMPDFNVPEMKIVRQDVLQDTSTPDVKRVFVFKPVQKVIAELSAPPVIFPSIPSVAEQTADIKVEETNWENIGDRYQCCSEEKLCFCQLQKSDKEYRIFKEGCSPCSDYQKICQNTKLTAFYNEFTKNYEEKSDGICSYRCKQTLSSCGIDVCHNCNKEIIVKEANCFNGKENVSVQEVTRGTSCFKTISEQFECRYETFLYINGKKVANNYCLKIF